ncbi:MAG: CueP family metal-binding protein [Desulfobacteraceae bacterium]|nr:CueP family metal-binding protein [Desulfobacteraceae bacterium]
MSSCQGELANTAFQVQIKDSNGRSLFQGEKVTMDNGFFDLWLPRDKKLELIVSRNGKRATEQVSTHAGSKTCYTTLELSVEE